MSNNFLIYQVTVSEVAIQSSSVITINNNYYEPYSDRAFVRSSKTEVGEKSYESETWRVVDLDTTAENVSFDLRILRL